MLGKVFALLTGDVNNVVCTLSEFFGGLGIGEREVDDDLITGRPVSRCSDGVLGGELAGVNGPEDLVEVAPARGGIRHHQRNRLVGLDNEDGTNGQGEAGLVTIGLVEDADGRGMVPLGIAEERDLHLGARSCLDVLDPGSVRVGIVAGEAANLDAALFPLGIEAGGGGKFRGTDRSEIARMHEDESPVVAKILVEIKVVGKLRGSLEVRELLVRGIGGHK